jgi:hypothetical protein
MPEKIGNGTEPQAPPVKPASVVVGVPNHLPPFDIQAALARTNGKPKLLRNLMLGFRDR